MKVILKNKFMSLGGSSTVTDESGEQLLYKVKGKIISPTRKKKIYDKEGKLLYIVRNKWFNWFTHKAFIYDGEKNKIGTVKDKYFDLKNQYFLEGYKDEIKFEGKFFGVESKILRNGEVMANLSTKAVTIMDNFVIDANEEDIPFIVAFLIAIDNIRDKKQNSRV